MNTRLRKSWMGAALLLLCLLVFTGCAEDEQDPPTSSSLIVDARLHGDWAECDEEWEYQTNGIRIASNGTLQWLGIDWTTGNSCLLEIPLFTRDVNITARDGRLIYRQLERGPDTLTYSLEGDRMEWLRGAFPVRRYRHITPNQHLFDPIDAGITAEIDGQPFATQTRLPYPPAWARIETRGNTIDVNIGCTDLWSFEFVVLGAYGPGTYPLAEQGKSWARLSQIGGDVIYAGGTNQQQRGTITFATIDAANKRITGTFAFDALSSGGDTIVVRNGTFNLPIRD